MISRMAERAYLLPILIMFFMLLYYLGGEDIVFFRKKRYKEEPKSQENLMSALNRFARTRSFKALGKTTIEFEGERHTYDAILLSYFGTVVFSANPRGGEIYGDNSKADWVQIFRGERETFANPLNELEGVSRFFREIYKKEDVKSGQTAGVVVFTNREVSVAVPKSIPACKDDKLAEMLLSKRFVADNGADIDAMKAAIDKYTVTE